MVVCFADGAVVGAICGQTTLANSWPTSLMLQQGHWVHFVVTLIVAFLSGLAVIFSLLDAQAKALAGVAISSALLIPAANAGLMWVAYFFTPQTYRDPTQALVLQIANLLGVETNLQKQK